MSSEQQILDSFRHLVQALRVGSRETEITAGVSGAQLFVLQKLKPKEKLSINELAERTHTHQSSVSVVVQKLVAKSLLRKEASLEDGRRALLSLTPRALRFLQSHSGLVQNRLFAAVHSLEPGQKKDLAKYLDLVVERAGLTQGPAPMFFEDEAEASHDSRKRRKKA